MPRVIEAIVNVYYTGARYYAGVDWVRFEEIVGDIETFRPRFRPRKPWRIRILSSLAGYRRAERLAVLYRRSKPGPVEVDGLSLKPSFLFVMEPQLPAAPRILYLQFQDPAAYPPLEHSSRHFR